MIQESSLQSIDSYPVIAQLVERETVVELIAGISRSLVRIRFAGFFYTFFCYFMIIVFLLKLVSGEFIKETFKYSMLFSIKENTRIG